MAADVGQPAPDFTLKSHALEEVSLNYALLLLSLPRTLGTDPSSGKDVTVGIGRYGPYVHRGGTYRNLKTPALLFEMTLDQALELLNTKPGREVIKELGAHPESGKDLQILNGRYGPYVTDGSLNASIPKSVDPEEVDMDDALDLLAKAKARKGKGGGREAEVQEHGGDPAPDPLVFAADPAAGRADRVDRHGPFRLVEVHRPAGRRLAAINNIHHHLRSFVLSH